jgi:hypothetical protein
MPSSGIQHFHPFLELDSRLKSLPGGKPPITEEPCILASSLRTYWGRGPDDIQGKPGKIFVTQKVVDEMEKQRRGIGQAVDPVKNAPMPRQKNPPGLESGWFV